MTKKEMKKYLLIALTTFILVGGLVVYTLIESEKRETKEEIDYIYNNYVNSISEKIKGDTNKDNVEVVVESINMLYKFDDNKELFNKYESVNEYTIKLKEEAIKNLNDSINILLTKNMNYYVYQNIKEYIKNEIYVEKENIALFVEVEDQYVEIERKAEEAKNRQQDVDSYEDTSNTNSPYTEAELINDPSAPSTNPNDYNSNGEYVPSNGPSDNPADYNSDGEYKPIEDMTEEEKLAELESFFYGQGE